ncbi:hypothetical protein GW17_00055590 [Ensete ventricosum]|nr:hypothetical protein GW17_00055590 [Ensete ventricosum]RZS11609.1 hypothetical protein BHM03_00042960 [Ensete ventricosum]
MSGGMVGSNWSSGKARTAQYDRYANRPLPDDTAKIDRRRSISAVDGRLKDKSTIGSRLKEKSTVGGRLRKKREEEEEEEEKKKEEEEKKKEEEEKNLASVPLLPAGDFSPHAGRRIPRRERERGVGNLIDKVVVKLDKALYRVVRYANRPLPSGTTKINRRRTISAVGNRFRPSVVDPRQSIE